MHKTDLKIKKIFLYSFLAAILVSAAIFAGVLKDMDRWTQDRLYQHPGITSSDILIVGIDEYALEEYGPYNTWDRNIMASALEALASDPDNLPAVVGIDVLYTGSSAPEADARLAEAAANLGCVVTASLAEYGQSLERIGDNRAFLLRPAVTGYYEPYDLLKDVSVQGHINAMADSDGVLRHALLYTDISEDLRICSMAVEAAEAFSKEKGTVLFTPPAASGGYLYIPYTAKPGGYDDGISIVSVINGEIPPAFWAGKIVLIGPWAPALQDAYFTSIDKAEPMYGVEIHANVIQCLLEGRYKTEVKDLPQRIVLFVFCLLAAALFLMLSVPKGAVLCLGLAVLSAAASLLLYRLGYVTHPLWLPLSALGLYIMALAVHYIESAKARRKLELEKERIRTELELAARIQESSLIREFPAFPDRQEFDLRAYMKPAREVGGDLYDFFMPDDDHLMMVIADVTGKGIPASLFMMTTMTLMRHVAMREKSPARTLETVNREMCARNPEQMFVTAWLGMLEISTGRLLCANAGHEYPAWKQPGGSFELFKDKHGLVIGGMEKSRYREYELLLKPGSKLFVYSDGVPEASDTQNQMFGTGRMIDALREAENGTSEELISAVSGAIRQFVGDAPQFDDITMLSLIYNGSSPDT